MRAAYALAERALPTYSCKFSRHDYTVAQLFACLTIREMFNRSYRGTEALLRDSPNWLADIGLDHAPDHNTLLPRVRCHRTANGGSETANSMVKRNQSSALRARTPRRREREMFLRAVVHNVTLA